MGKIYLKEKFMGQEYYREAGDWMDYAGAFSNKTALILLIIIGTILIGGVVGFLCFAPSVG